MAAAPLAGIDVGSSAIKVAEVERSKGQVVLRSCAVGKREGVSDAELLQRLCSEAGIRTREAALGLSSPEVVVKPFQYPWMPKAELSNAIRLEGESAILNGHSMDEMALDWHLFSSAPEGSLRGILAVVPKTVLTAPLQMARAAGLEPVVVDVEGLALWSAYWALVGRDVGRKTTLLINVGAAKTNLVVAKGEDDLILMRDFQRVAGSEKDWPTEVKDSLDYARSGAGLRDIDEVVLTGGGSDDRQVFSWLQSMLAAPATRWNPFKHLTREGQASQLEESVGPLFGVAIGLALRRLT